MIIGSFVKSRRYTVIIAVAAGLIIGNYRGSIAEHALSAVGSEVGHVVRVAGRIADDPDVGKDDEVIVRLDQLVSGERPVAGKLWVTTNRTIHARRGDRVVVEGKLAEGFGGFAGSVYQARIVSATRPIPGDVAVGIRDDFADKVRLGVSEPMASLGLGYLVGQRRALPDDLDQALKIAGLTHIVVASGYNLTILVRHTRRLLEKISKYLATAIPAGLIVSFIAITGMSPSMSRAGLVSGLSLLAWYMGRTFHPVTLLLFVAAITVLIQPEYAWGDLGWQLSFAAFAGVMIIAPLIHAYFYGAKKPGLLRQTLFETVSAQLATAPLIIAAFGTFSTVAIISNVLILPLIPYAMLLTFVTGIAGYIVPHMAAVVGWPTEVLLGYMVQVARMSAMQPWAQVEVHLSIVGVILSYCIMIAAVLWMRRATGYNLRTANLVE